MVVLKDAFTALGFRDVATFIASGNVIFDTTPGDPASLERRIEEDLRSRLGYDVATFVRTPAELSAVAACEPWPESVLTAADTRYVVFLKGSLDRKTAASVLGLANDRDLLAFAGRDLHWLCHGNLLDSSLQGPILGRAIGSPITSRNLNTVRRLTDKYPPGSGQ